jgi:hypothetical protein
MTMTMSLSAADTMAGTISTGTRSAMAAITVAEAEDTMAGEIMAAVSVQFVAAEAAIQAAIVEYINI